MAKGMLPPAWYAPRRFASRRTPALGRRQHLEKPLPAQRLVTVALALLAALFAAAPAAAYIGPGAGFALMSSFLVLLATVALAFLSLLAWPVRTLWRVVRRKKPPKAHVRRLVFVGLDGQDPRLTERMMKEGKLPNFKRLSKQGSYRRIASTYPALSPVAWSTFATGANPGKHNIFDFLDRDLRSYLPKLSSAHIGRVERFLKLGKWKIPLQKPEIRMLRRSKPFWTVLGERNVWSTVLRVPITFPPDRFYGAQLAAMCVPDLVGSQGTFLLYTTRPARDAIREGGVRVPLSSNGSGPDHFDCVVEGPENSFLEGDPPPPLRAPMTIEVDREEKTATVSVAGETVDLQQGQLSDWVRLEFRAAPGIKVHGLTRMLLTEAAEHTSLYLTAIHIDPEKPAMPISHPSYYAPYLAKRVGDFATLGLAEDTTALNEGVTDDATFLRQSYDIDREREEMFFAALERLRKGSLTCVFDATDRIQHMFWRYMEDGHPAANGRKTGKQRRTIEEHYRHNDALVGRVMEKLADDDLLIVLSDHGFASFRRGVNLNRWLLDHGYLVLREDADGTEEWLEGVDWTRTRAYALGLAGVFLNLRGREAGGIVEPGEEARALKRELIAAWDGLRDEERSAVGINAAFDAEDLYTGPYKGNAPDLIVGYNDGYRVSWDCAVGVVAGPVFSDNTKAWSGDHCVDPRLVPGIFFSSRPVDRDDDLSLLDMAPTALALFGIDKPDYMEGESVFDPAGMAA